MLVIDMQSITSNEAVMNPTDLTRPSTVGYKLFLLS